MAEICIKNVLYTLDEKIEEKAFYSEIIKEIEFKADYGYIEKSVNNAIKKFEDELCFYKSILQSPSENPFRIIFYEVLPYRVPLAAQCLLSPSHDLWNNEINDLAEIHSDKLQILHLLVLPLKSTSVILLFTIVKMRYTDSFKINLTFFRMKRNYNISTILSLHTVPITLYQKVYRLKFSKAKNYMRWLKRLMDDPIGDRLQLKI